ncbi:HalOD1 output domain-containing protein [Halosolutus amylolyticus]|uniref:HalOD1 output domain-containing protein n=1 Tax=Halosolutus amylolyticus TaxID=2932267 RepID=A0ABD5PPL2_9EURY|nr:HalOD1 output domain-containing protein [Halosolutus amylolyticus]
MKYRTIYAGIFIHGCLRTAVNPAQTTTTSWITLREPDSITEAIVTAVADAEGTSPLELQPLATVIDPDALDKLVRADENVTAEFAYHGYQVCVSGDGQVAVRE